MVNTRTDAELAAVVQNALQTLLPQIRAEICEEFRTGSGPSSSGGNPPPAKFKELFFLQFFPRAEQERLKREYHSIRQTDTETSMEFMQRFLTDVAQVANAARNYEILHERDDDGAERGGGDNHRNNNNYSGNNNRSSDNGRDQRNRVSSPTDLSIMVSSSPGVPLRAT
nr:hypothetical protein [Tanacetum cinerariifolium]